MYFEINIIKSVKIYQKGSLLLGHIVCKEGQILLNKNGGFGSRRFNITADVNCGVCKGTYSTRYVNLAVGDLHQSTN